MLHSPIEIQHTRARAAIRTEHILIASLLLNMLAVFTRIPDAAFVLGLGAIAHVLILARTFRNSHLVTRTAVEAGGRLRIGRVAYLILSTAIDAAPSVVTVGAMLAVDVYFLEPGEVGGDTDGMVERMVLVARGAFASVVAFEAVGAMVGRVGEVGIACVYEGGGEEKQHGGY